MQGLGGAESSLDTGADHEHRSFAVEAALVEWGERLFYPGNRIVKANTPRLGPWGTSRATLIRHRIEATVRAGRRR